MASDTSTQGIYGIPICVKGTEIKPWCPPSVFKTFGLGIDHPLSNEAHFSLEKATVAFFEKQFNVDDSSIKFKKGVSSDAGYDAEAIQIHDGIAFRNIQGSMSFDICNKVIAFGASFIKLDPSKIAPSKPKVCLDDAMKTAAYMLDGKAHARIDGDLKQQLAYLAKEDGSAVLTYFIIVRNEAKGTMFEAYVDAHSGQLVSVIDLVFRCR